MLPDDEETEIKIIRNCLKELENEECEKLPFFLDHVRQVLRNCLNKTSNANRWDDNVIALEKTIRFMKGKSFIGNEYFEKIEFKEGKLSGRKSKESFLKVVLKFTEDMETIEEQQYYCDE